MGSLTFRLGHVVLAATLGAMRSALVLAAIIVVSLPIARIAGEWYATGRVEILPAPVTRTRDLSALRVGDASVAERRNVREAVAGLRYEIDPRAVSVLVIEGDPLCVGCAGEFLPYLDVIRIERTIVDRDGIALSWTVAHEIGHYVDSRYMSQRTRDEFRRMRGIPASLPWLGGNVAWDRSPGEDFAEVFAALAVPAAVQVPGTAYGPVRDSARFERLLADAGVPLDRPAPAEGWTEIVRREVAFARTMLDDPRVSLPLLALFGAYIAFGAVPAAIDAWYRPLPPEER